MYRAHKLMEGLNAKCTCGWAIGSKPDHAADCSAEIEWEMCMSLAVDELEGLTSNTEKMDIG